MEQSLSSTEFPSGSSSEISTQQLEIKKEPLGLFDKLSKSLSANPYFSAGAGLLGIGAAASVSKRLLVLANAAFRRRFLTTLEIENTDSGYAWVLDYINRQSAHKTNKLTVNTWVDQAESGKTATKFFLLPGRGVHYFWYNYRLIKVERNRENQTVQRQGVRVPLETVTLSTYQADANFWKNLLNEASREALAKAETGLVLYNAVGHEWHRFGNPRPKRPLSSIILEDGVSQQLQDDFERFLAYEKRYRNRGIPYRRGYLFYGPPGTGKTSFISAMAGHYGYSICMLSLSEPTLDDLRLVHLLNTAPKNSFILLEDVDAAMPSSRDEDTRLQHKAYEGILRLTPSGLLNAIDGVASAEDRVLFMTTNHVERLDPALIRPGRVDLKQYFGHCTLGMLQKMFKRFYEDYAHVNDELCAQFAKKAMNLNVGLSPAQIQGHLQLFENDPPAAIRNLDRLVVK